MAYISNQDDEELKKQQSQQSGGFLGNGGVGAGVTGAPKPSTASGSGWTNLRSYLDANKDQSVDMSNKIAGNITKTGDEARNTIQSGVKNYETELSKSNTNVNDLISRASSDPVGFSKSNDVQSFKNIRDGIFSGPSAFENSSGYGAIADAADKGSKLKTLAETEGGQQELIRKLNPNMGQGKVDLNQLLVSGNQDARTNLVNAAKPYANLRAELDEAAGKQNSARDQAIQGTQAASNQIREQFVTPQQQSLKTLQDQINARVTESSKDFNKDQVIRDLQAYMGGQETLDPTEKAQFLPESGNFTGYDMDGLRARVRSSMIAGGIPASLLSPEYIEKGVSYMLGNDNIGLSADESNILSPLRQDAWKYSNDPFEKLRGEGAINDPNWLDTYFGGTNISSGNPTPQSVASADEYARILALQNLLDQPEFFNEADLALAGTYNPARIGKYQPRITNNTGTQLPGTPPQQPNPLNPDEELWQNGPNRFF